MKKFVTLNPAAILFVVNAVGALVVAWGGHFTTDQLAVVDGVITAVLTLVATLATRPVGLQLVVGGGVAVITALAPLGLHLTSAQISTGSVVVSIVLAGVFHLAHVPYVAAKQGTTAHAIQGVKSA
jgi:hypothetical protein